MFYFLPEDFEDLNDQIERIREKIKELGREAGESCQEGAETWHDNFAFEESQRQQYMWSKRLRELIHIRDNACVIRPSPQGDKASIGRVVTIRDVTTGETQTFKIGSYMIFGEREGVSYNAPLARTLIGSEVDDERTGKIGGRQKTFRILKIE